MKNWMKKRRDVRLRRSMRVRKTLRGTAAKPRMSIYKSNKHIHVQLIDDDLGVTLGSISTLAKDFRQKKSKEVAGKLGQKIGEIAAEKNIKEVVFDRGRFKYHGILAELANAARETGLCF